MDTPLIAGERLAPPIPDPDDERPAKPPADRKRTRAPKARRKGGVLRFLGRVFGFFAGIVLLAGVVGAVVGWHMYQKFSADLPTLDILRDYQPRVMSRVYAGDSRLIGELATERRIFVPFTAIPDMVKQAFVSAEDQKFWTHHGLDPAAIARAAWIDFQQWGQGKRPVGASTITQQVAKNMLLGGEISLSRKAKEAILALRIEHSLGKERILELYLNEIYLGLRAYGVAAAAQTYFNKSLNDLTLPEAAFLAALPKAPNNYDPFKYPDAARARRDWVLDRMAEDRAITPEQAREAKATPIIPSPFRRPETVPGSEWFAEEVRRQLIDRYGSDGATQGGFSVRTSLDPALQTVADQVLRRGLMAYDRQRGGWRGAAGHLDGGPLLARGWSNQLDRTPRPPGMLPEWKLAVVLDVTGNEAKAGWIDRPINQPGAPGPSRVASILLSDTAWARPLRNGQLGPTPRRMADIVQVGDLVMAELAPATAPEGRKPGQPERLLLRQIPGVQGALVSIDPMTGRVLAMSGGWSFENSQFNRATQAQRQPGSSFKPMVYLTAMIQNISPSQRVLDAPFVLDQGAAGQWRPNNFGGSYAGPIPIRLALERSLNLVTVRLADKVGMDAVAQTAISFHVVDSMSRYLPNALGAVETTVLRQAGAYAALSQGGREVQPTLIDSIQDRDGHVVWRAPGLDCRGCGDAYRMPTIVDSRRQIADAPSVSQIVTMMQGVVQRGTGFAAGQGLGRAIAGKTGTSQDFNDAWFVGFTPDLVTAVWVGYDQPTSLGNNETGGAIAAPIFHDFMAFALRGRPNLTFRVPPGVTMASWDTGSGSRTDAFKPGQDPGASNGVIGGGETTDSDVTASTGTGVDSGMGGLY